ncbi:MAG: Crp/Fnr family transcriptional regulator [Bowdeniella nasicola]|nr:Crp/Fnr family transcriptional regulator [Bowdeniella nasicola]
MASPADARRTTPLAHSCARAHRCPRPLRLRVLARTPLFANLNLNLADIDRRMRARGFNAGEYLYQQGETASHLYIVAAGRAKVIRTNTGGDLAITNILGPGDLFGGLEFLGVARHHESVQALQTTCALQVDAPAFRQLLTDYPAVALRAFDELATQLRETHDAFAHATTAPLQARVAEVLLRLAAKFGDDTEVGELIEVPLSRADLAAMCAATTESVSRIMSAFKRDGLIDSGRNWTALTNRMALEDIAAQFAVN